MDKIKIKRNEKLSVRNRKMTEFFSKDGKDGSARMEISMISESQEEQLRWKARLDRLEKAKGLKLSWEESRVDWQQTETEANKDGSNEDWMEEM
jgi:hypothetical protein